MPTLVQLMNLLYSLIQRLLSEFRLSKKDIKELTYFLVILFALLVVIIIQTILIKYSIR